MKKLIFVLTLLLLVSPAFANINISCTTDACEVSLNYSMDTDPCDANRPVAFGLDIQVDSSAVIDVPYSVNPSFWVYPGTRTYTGTPPAVDSNGTPYADYNDYTSDTYHGPGTGGMTLEMGALFSPPEVNSPNVPASSGLLLKFTVDTDCNVTVAENSIRGGVVMVGGEDADPNLTGCQVDLGCFPSCHDDYSEWQTVGKPIEWCNPRQCRGDADGLIETVGRGTYWVGYVDLQVLVDNWLDKAGIPSALKADFDHALETVGRGTYRCGYVDLQVLVDNWLDKVGSPADCLDCP